MLTALKRIGSWIAKRRPPQFAVGTVFEMETSGGIPTSRYSYWRVLQIHEFLNVQHATTEQLATGKTKTIAVSAILRCPGFRIVAPDEAQKLFLPNGHYDHC